MFAGSVGGDVRVCGLWWSWGRMVVAAVFVEDEGGDGGSCDGVGGSCENKRQC